MSGQKINKKQTQPQELDSVKASVNQTEVSTETSKLEQTVKTLETELANQKDAFLRMAAEYENYRKRTERDKLNIYQDATAAAIIPILTVADSLSYAVSAQNTTLEELKKGLQLVTKQFTDALEKLEVKSFGQIGEIFDPDLHNAIAHIEDPSLADNYITEVFQPGYKLKEKVIRYASVKVAN